jgi:hypothetical protein
MGKTRCDPDMALCYHELPATYRTTASGRAFLACGCSEPRCDFFAWVESLKHTNAIYSCANSKHKLCDIEAVSPSSGNGLCMCGAIVVKDIDKRGYAFTRCAFKVYRQYMACKPLPCAPTASARLAEKEHRTTYSVSALVNRPAQGRQRVSAGGWLQHCSPYEQMTQQADMVLTSDTGAPDWYVSLEESEIILAVDKLCDQVCSSGGCRGTDGPDVGL